MNEQLLGELQKKLGYKFKDISMLETALSHSSYVNERKRQRAASNERLEFLGDSILGMTVAKLIYVKYPTMSEGRMTRLRAELVCEKSLAALAEKLDLGKCILLGYGEEKSGGRKRPSILADAVEAILASVYLEAGPKKIETLVARHLMPLTETSKVESTDHKSALQERVQIKPDQALSYHMTGESGPDHQKSFTMEVRLNGESIGNGSGPTKKKAEQNAAKSALERLSGG